MPIERPDPLRPDPLRHVMPGPRLAVVAEALFLINLMLAPGLAFLVLMVLWAKHHKHPDPLVRNHLRQTGWTCIWGGTLLVSLSVAIFALGGFDNPWSWVIGVLYFTLVHAGLILLGVLGLSRAINGRSWRYPIFGPREHD
ncbi:cytochrome c oxidase subunit III [Thauera humireducens]|uniref:Uncharacterized protein n=1 Tax=Thauera humireducens TaxID=1134435 RepID=A0A127K3P7_9RHOO|nr:cytochrome c oxidase subunit III [Thauera humireducens]AMO36578.1 hypothetical protein AC731_006265 [Thauera humireducens]